MDLKKSLQFVTVDWVNLAQNTQKCWTLVSTVTNIRVQQKDGLRDYWLLNKQ
jgi:hypothetical protein